MGGMVAGDVASLPLLGLGWLDTDPLLCPFGAVRFFLVLLMVGVPVPCAVSGRPCALSSLSSVVEGRVIPVVWASVSSGCSGFQEVRLCLFSSAVGVAIAMNMSADPPLLRVADSCRSGGRSGLVVAL